MRWSLYLIFAMNVGSATFNVNLLTHHWPHPRLLWDAALVGINLLAIRNLLPWLRMALNGTLPPKE